MAFADKQFALTLVGLDFLLKRAAKRHPEFAARLNEKDLVAQIRLATAPGPRVHHPRRQGRLAAGLHPAPDLTMIFDTADVAVRS